jgi:hypothetical protein
MELAHAQILVVGTAKVTKMSDQDLKLPKSMNYGTANDATCTTLQDEENFYTDVLVQMSVKINNGS